MTIAIAVPIGQVVGIGSCKSTARRKGGGGRGGVQWKKKRSIRRRGLCGILPCEDKLTPPLLCPFGVVSSLWSLVVQWLGYMTLTHEIRVQFPARDPCLERLGSQLAYASGDLSRLDIYS